MPKFDPSNPWLRAALIGLVALIIAAKWGISIKDDHIGSDADHNIEMAYNLVMHGVLSASTEDLDGDGRPKPTNYREPVPSLGIAPLIAYAAIIDGPKDLSYFKKGNGAKFLKYSNMFWGTLMCIGVAAALWALTGSLFAAAAAALAAGTTLEANSYITESPAAALLALVSLFFMLAVKHGRARDFALAGLCLGALILAKAAFQFVAIVLFAGLALWLASRVYRGVSSARSAALNTALFGLAIGVVVGPWMARNYVYLGSPQITQRGGIVLLTRAIKNQMTPTEYIGAFYVWAPSNLRGTMGRLLGFGPEDMQKGGRLQRLNRNESDFLASDKIADSTGHPENAISYYRQARAERVKLKLQLRSEGVPQAAMRGDNILQKRAMEMILADPLKHLATTLPFLWRGAAHEAPILGMVALLALWWRRSDLFAYAMPAILMIAFYTLLSHNIPRYNDPVFAVQFAAVIAALCHAFVLRTGWRIP